MYIYILVGNLYKVYFFVRKVFERGGLWKEGGWEEKSLGGKDWEERSGRNNMEEKEEINFWWEYIRI